jgi:serine/threonine-protein kinase HipA
MDLAFLAADHFGIGEAKAKEVAGQVASAIVRWRDVARAMGASDFECDRMASAFEHDDLVAATRA